MRWLQRLQTRWKVGSMWQVVLILLAFACTGFTVAWLMKPILLFLFGETIPVWGKILYWIFILPVYNLALLFWGFVFGQFQFFFEFEKRFFRLLASWFKR